MARVDTLQARLNRKLATPTTAAATARIASLAKKCRSGVRIFLRADMLEVTAAQRLRWRLAIEIMGGWQTSFPTARIVPLAGEPFWLPSLAVRVLMNDYFIGR